MFGLIKGFSTKTIAIAVCVIIAVLLSTTIFYYKTNNKNLMENGALKSDNVVMQQNEAFTESSAQITDQVVKDYVTETLKANTATEKLRKESIHEYVKAVEPAKDGTIRQDNDPAGDERVARLANRLLENYCRIRPEDPDCDSLNVTSGLPSRQGAQ